MYEIQLDFFKTQEQCEIDFLYYKKSNQEKEILPGIPNSEKKTPANLIGQRFFRLVVFEKIIKNKKVRWKLKCDCGGETEADTQTLRRGYCKSCGCYQIEKSKQMNTSHGKKGTRVYNIWNSMKMRCINKNQKDYNRYGGIGIKICDEWMSFENFYKDMGDPEKGMSLERIDNNKGYSKENCKWATYKEQGHNKKTTIRIFFNGVERNLYGLWNEYSRPLGLHYSTIQRRIKKGMCIEDALIKPSERRHICHY